MCPSQHPKLDQHLGHAGWRADPDPLPSPQELRGPHVRAEQDVPGEQRGPQRGRWAPPLVGQLLLQKGPCSPNRQPRNQHLQTCLVTHNRMVTLASHARMRSQQTPSPSVGILFSEAIPKQPCPLRLLPRPALFRKNHPPPILTPDAARLRRTRSTRWPSTPRAWRCWWALPTSCAS